MTPSRLVSHSRPRFWVYLIGPVLVALASTGSLEVILDWRVLVVLAYVTLPANLLIYGVNDIFDGDTDQHNAKKQGYERQAGNQSSVLLQWVFLTNLPFLFLLPWLPWQALLGWLGFVFFGVMYSAPPIRAKAVPVLDAMFNLLYVFPAFGLVWMVGGFVSLPVVFASLFWVMAMHAFSAVPDIQADTKAGLNTIATQFGKHGTIALCATLYVASALLVVPIFGWGILAFSVPYVWMMFLAATAKTENALFNLYARFPWVNTVVGFALFCLVVIQAW